jgi:hypothetical protein
VVSIFNKGRQGLYYRLKVVVHKRGDPLCWGVAGRNNRSSRMVGFMDFGKDVKVGGTWVRRRE